MRSCTAGVSKVRGLLSGRGLQVQRLLGRHPGLGGWGPPSGAGLGQAGRGAKEGHPGVLLPWAELGVWAPARASTSRLGNLGTGGSVRWHLEGLSVLDGLLRNKGAWTRLHSGKSTGRKEGSYGGN